MDRLQRVQPEILEHLRHLEMTDRVDIPDRRPVGLGSYGDILQGVCSTEGSSFLVAAKQLRVALGDDITGLFEKEIYVWSKLRHRNILPLLGFMFDTVTGFPMFISPWLNNGSLHSYLKKERGDPFGLVIDIAEGLSYLHGKDVVHSDFKPENILVDDFGRAMICDFGFSRMVMASRSMALLSSNAKGTVRYMAYELLMDPSQRNSKEADVWAFGMIVYEILTKERVYSECRHEALIMSAILSKRLPALPANLNHAVWPGRSVNAVLLSEIAKICWNHDPSQRPPMHEICHLLRANDPLLARSREYMAKMRQRGADFKEGSLDAEQLALVRMTDAPGVKIDASDVPVLSKLYLNGHLPVIPKAQQRFEPDFLFLDRIALYFGDYMDLGVDALVYETDGAARYSRRVCEGSINTMLLNTGGDEFVHEFFRRRLYQLELGAAIMTDGCEFPTAKYIIHTRGPGIAYEEEDWGPVMAETSLIGLCYERSLGLANRKSLRSIAFTPISTNAESFPIEEGIRIALEATRRYMDMQQSRGRLRLQHVIFVVPDARHREVYEKLVPIIFPARSLED